MSFYSRYRSYESYWPRRPSVGEIRQNAAREGEQLRKQGEQLSPVVLQGHAIATTFWGKAWCRNLERYSDYSNRIPRGRSYVRNGSVVDLQMAAGEVSARVSGSRLYTVSIKIAPVKPAQWTAICRDCTGGIDSLVELLQGQFSQAVMERVCAQGTGLFPTPGEIDFDCSCPDWASMCKHVAAVLYGVGARLDEKPELLFHLRKVDATELIAHAGKHAPLSATAPAAEKVLQGTEVGALFGLEMAQPEPTAAAPAKRAGKREARRPRAKPAQKFRPGQRVSYRQGRATIEAKVVANVVGAGDVVTLLLLERLRDGKQIVRATSKVLA